MSRVVSPTPQFTSLTEAEVMAALNDANPANPNCGLWKLRRSPHGAVFRHSINH